LSRVEFAILFSFVTNLFKSHDHKDSDVSQKSSKLKQHPNILEHSILDLNGTFLPNFTLFHYDNTRIIDIIIFLPHYGLYFGEKISWTASQLKGASVELSTKQSKKSPTTNLEVTQQLLHQKLEDVLSFDSTPIERFFWMEHLCESEFDELDPSFHKLLSKERLIFADDDIQNIQDKLCALNDHQEKPYSKLKVLGSLQAHSLLLPTKEEPFGAFLSSQQQLLFDAPPPVPKTITVITGKGATGKSTVLIRKVLQLLLHDTQIKAAIITPTLLSGDILRTQLIALCEFAAITLDYSRIQFLNPSTPQETITLDAISKEVSLIVYDDPYDFNEDFIGALRHKIGTQTIFVATSAEYLDEYTYPLAQTWRTPTINTLHYSHPKEAPILLLVALREHASPLTETILIVLNNDETLLAYQIAIDEYFHTNTQIITSTFSLQYKNLDNITLATTPYLSGITASYCFIVDIAPEHLDYPTALSRASKGITIISPSQHQKEHSTCVTHF
jgi:hypothetical protein